MKLLLLSLLVLGARADYHQKVTVYSDDQSGKSRTFTDYVSNMNEQKMNDVISSAVVTGVWIFYENVNYAGQTFMERGINKQVAMPDYIDNKVSSLRYAGNLQNFSTSAISVYSGKMFTGPDYYIDDDKEYLRGFQGKFQSLILMGESPWTLYANKNFKGAKTCLYPDSEVQGSGEVFKVAAFASVQDIGFHGKRIGSVKKGCGRDI